MKVRCIDNKHLLPGKGTTRLTLGKVYDVKEENCNRSFCYLGYIIINDIGEEETFVIERFERLRSKNLEELGI